MAATPSSAPEATLARAPLVEPVAEGEADAPDDDAAAMPAAAAEPDADEDAADDDEDALLSWLTSWGTMNWPLAAPMLRVPSALMMLGLAAMNERVYMTFSAIRDCDQSGMVLMSMLSPHVAAIGLLLMLLAAYMAERVELLDIMAGIIDATEVAALFSTLGALTIPNIPLGQ